MKEQNVIWTSNKRTRGRRRMLGTVWSRRPPTIKIGNIFQLSLDYRVSFHTFLILYLLTSSPPSTTSVKPNTDAAVEALNPVLGQRLWNWITLIEVMVSSVPTIQRTYHWSALVLCGYYGNCLLKHSTRRRRTWEAFECPLVVIEFSPFNVSPRSLFLSISPH